MMQRDYTAFIISESQALIDQLAQYEVRVEEARQAQDRAGRDRAEADSRRVRRKLLTEGDPPTSFLYGVATDVYDSDAFRSEWQPQAMQVDAYDTLKKWDIDGLFADYWDKITTDLALLPPYSFSLSLTFALAQPYISKDDNPFYIIDNPILRDKVFRLPMVRPSSWKGNLRAALQHLGHPDNDTVVHRLFGKVNEANDDGLSGRLVLYPTFFTRTSLEIINPHDRVRRVGKNPILFESVPIDATGRFTLLYVPYDRVGREQDKTASEVAADLEVLAKGLRAMFTLYGFGAKTSSGFGTAQEVVKDGKLTLRVSGLQTESPREPPPEVKPAEALPRYLEATDRLKPEYRNPDGSFRRRSEGELNAMKKADRQLYDKAKSWWERADKALAEQGPQLEPVVAAPTPAPNPPWPSWDFASFDALVAMAGQIAQQLTQGGAS